MQNQQQIIDNPLFPSSNYSSTPIKSSTPHVLFELTKKVTNDDENQKKKYCTFCKIIAGELPCVKIFENDDVLAFLASPSTIAAIGASLPMISNAICQALNIKDFNILQNNGSFAGQVVFHVHFHIIPRFKDEDNINNRNRRLHGGRLKFSQEEREKIGGGSIEIELDNDGQGEKT
ncbi:7109_t:CDS:2 [Entrophospora sp. SA101]|nr:12888_t:CDS:2 [Entrophospora sp. SA101]CAJ0827143.1 7109_t:CDS:2 [Entrophospora sp. SA101]